MSRRPSFRIRVAPFVVATLALLHASCHDEARTPLDTAAVPPPRAAVVQAEAGAFGFLPPLGAHAGGQLDAAVLHELEVRVCRLSGDACTGDLVAHFDATSPGAARLRVSGAAFMTNWATPKVSGAPQPHRIEVRLAGRPLGAADAWLLRNARDAAGAPAHVATVVGGQTLPIRFYATEPDDTNVVGPDGATIVEGDVVLVISPGALAEPVAIGITRVADDADDALALPGAWELTPHGLTFDVPATLTLPYDVSGSPAGTSPVLFRDEVPFPNATYDPVAGTATVQIDGFSRWFFRGFFCAPTALVAVPEPLIIAPGATALLSILTDDDVTHHFVALDTRDATVAQPRAAWMIAPGNVLVDGVAEGATTLALSGTALCPAWQQDVAVIVRPPVATISLEPVAATITVGAQQTFTATPRDADGNALARDVAWSVAGDDVASIDVAGATLTATALETGSTVITATSEGVIAFAGLEVVPVPVATVTIEPAEATIRAGATHAFTATPRDADGNELPDRPVTWTSSDDDVATVDDGVATGVMPGTVVITATAEGVSAAVTLHVGPGDVATVDVEPATATIVASATQTFTVVLRDAFGNVLTDRAVSWTSGDDAVATIDETGTATGIAPGTVVITATSEDVSADATLEVVPVPVATVVVSPASVSLTVGDTRAFAATAHDADGNPLSDRHADWTSSDDDVASVDAAGIVTAAASGAATITATIDGVNGTASVEVTANPTAIERVPLPDGMTVAAGSENIIVAPDGTAYALVCGTIQVDGSPRRFMVTARSTDGVLWEQRSTFEMVDFCGLPWLGIDDAGSLHVGARGLARRSDDGGASWSEPQQVPMQTFAAAPNGDRFTISHGGLSGPFRVNRSVGGAPFEEIAIIPRLSGVTQVEFPSIAVGSAGVVHAVWRQNACGFCSVFYSRSTNNGETWSTPVRVSNLRADVPSLAADAAGTVVPVWHYRENTDPLFNNYMAYNISRNDGASWLLGSNGAVDTDGHFYEFQANQRVIAAGNNGRFYSFSRFATGLEVRSVSGFGDWRAEAHILDVRGRAIAASPVRWCVLVTDSQVRCGQP